MAHNFRGYFFAALLQLRCIMQMLHYFVSCASRFFRRRVVELYTIKIKCFKKPHISIKHNCITIGLWRLQRAAKKLRVSDTHVQHFGGSELRGPRRHQ